MSRITLKTWVTAGWNWPSMGWLQWVSKEVYRDRLVGKAQT